MLKGCRDFIMKGNVVDLAVAVMIGAEFGAVVDSLVKDDITPLIGAVGGTPDFSELALAPIKIGDFLNAIIAFLVKAAAVYFIVVVPVQRAMAMMAGPKAAAPAEPPADVKLLTEIRDLLKTR
ncbi:MAG: large conductance mechanosensitive channel protein MscL [Armatimonadetes bacterium]|nr:large conductance mechanosensitive channel protein MscL [Armatimonadota bacterium]